MNLSVIGTGSSGNTYILEANDYQQLIIDCGCPLKEVKKKLNFHLSDIAGVIVSHAHG